MRAYGLYVPLTTAEYDRLRDLARTERRPLRDQAAVLLAQALGVWSIGAPATDHTSPASTVTLVDAQQGECGASA